jgi:CRP/FNR family transcriptional regulator, cyclic AMP receptor protein
VKGSRGEEQRMDETPERTGTEETLAGIDLFSGLSRRQLRKLIGRASEVDHAAEHEITTEGLGGLAFHLILSGEVVVRLGGSERRLLGPGDHFGEITMIDGRPRSASVTATRPTRTLAIPHQVFDELLHQEPEFAHGLLRILCARLREADARGRKPRD